MKGMFVVQVPPADVSHHVSIAAEVMPIAGGLPQMHLHFHMHVPAPVAAPAVPLPTDLEPAVTSSSPVSVDGVPSARILPEPVTYDNPLYGCGSDSKVCAQSIHFQGTISKNRRTN